MKKNRECYGITPACMTIWKEDQSYDPKGMETYIRWLLDQGAQSLSICGSTGENIAMTIEEQKQIMEHVLGFVAGEVPVFVGTGKYATKQTIELSQHAEKYGADGVMVILPYYMNPHKKAVLDGFRELRKNIDINIMVYNNPWFAGYELDHKEIKQLLDEGVITSVKSAHGDPSRVHELKYFCGDKLTVMYGHDYAALEGLLCGADGWLSGFPAVLPKQCRALWDVCQEKDVDKAIAVHQKMQPYIDYFFNDKKDGVPHWQEICKYTLNVQGLPAGKPRMPLGELDDENKRKVEKLLADMM